MSENGAERSKNLERTSMVTMAAVGQHIRAGCEGDISGGNNSEKLTCHCFRFAIDSS